MLLSKTSEYAIRMVFYLLRDGNTDQYIRLNQIADALGVSFYQLTKVAQKLIQAGVLISYTGPNGGIALSSDSNRIRLVDVVAPIEGEDFFDRCVLGLNECGREDPCPVHSYWEEIKIRLNQLFQDTTLEEIRENNPMGRLSLK